MKQIAITGAAGFLGQALVRAARAKGYGVLAIIRNAPDPAWADDSAITTVAVDLGDASAAQLLSTHLAKTDGIIHAAASFGGDAATHARDTIGATENLVKAMAQTPQRLVLVSSLSVYDVAAMSDNATLNEASPLLQDAAQRDAYAAAKVAQEQIVRDALTDFRIMRPGAIYGPGRLWSAQLGFAKAGIVFCPGGNAKMPAVHVDHVAAGLIAGLDSDQPAQIVNLIDADTPSQMDWLNALGLRTLRVPRGIVLLAGKLLGRGPAWAARFRPLHYDTTQAEQLLGPMPDHAFGAAIRALRLAEKGQS